MLALALAFAVVFYLSAGGSVADLTAAPTRQQLADAVAQYGRAPLVHETGTYSRDGHTYRLDVTIARGGDSQGTVAYDGRAVQYRSAGVRAYVLADQAYWAPLGKLASYLGGKWVTSSEVSTRFSTAALGRSLSLLDVAQPGATFTRRGGATRVGGVPAVALIDRRGELFVSTAGPARLLRVASRPGYRSFDGVTDVRIDLDYPAGSLNVQVPSPVVDAGSMADLPALYDFQMDSWNHGGDCSSSGTCTITGTVHNGRGPQVGSPSVEFELWREDTGSSLGSCVAPISPVGHDQTETVSCTVSGPAWTAFTFVGGYYAGTVTVHNPFYDD